VAETVTIESLGHGGHGIAETAAGRTFVPYTLPGETVEIERDGEHARLTRIVTASTDRVAPICRHFGVCGNCALEHMGPPAYRAWKTEQVRVAFAQRGISTEVAPIVPIAPGTRRRAIFSAIRTPHGTVFGFHERHSDQIVQIEECATLVPAIVSKLAALRAIANIVLSRWKPARITVLACDNGLDIAVAGAGKSDRTMLEKLAVHGSDPAIARLVVDNVEVFRNRVPEILAGAANLQPTPGGFVQAARPAEEAMAAAVVDHVGNAKTVADLFCGIGTFTFRLAASAPVTAVESDAALLAALEAGSRKAKGLRKITTRRRDLFTNPLALVELAAFEAVVFDPPAAGAKAQAEMLAKSTVPKVIAVSCNPATLARDARILIDGGYRLTRVLPVDQFLFSAEIEAVATFSR
jgi:23S rRNA (uracil1939-C5)-methyltransferase